MQNDKQGVLIKIRTKTPITNIEKEDIFQKITSYYFCKILFKKEITAF